MVWEQEGEKKEKIKDWQGANVGRQQWVPAAVDGQLLSSICCNGVSPTSQATMPDPNTFSTMTHSSIIRHRLHLLVWAIYSELQLKVSLADLIFQGFPSGDISTSQQGCCLQVTVCQERVSPLIRWTGFVNTAVM